MIDINNPPSWARHETSHLHGRAPEKPLNCEICGLGEKLELDHCHNSGRFRGWLCRRCNMMLGWAKDNPDLLRKARYYLLKPMVEQGLINAIEE